MVVLFGSDPRVMAYARSVQQKFLDASIDVWIHNHLSGNSADIKPEHLVSVITSTNSDYLIVIGDRNMKNSTCQGRKSGKLVEMTLEHRIRTLLSDWGEKTGLCPAAIRNSLTVGDTVDPGTLSEQRVVEILRRYGRAGNVRERLARLQVQLTELEEWKKEGGGAGQRGGSVVAAAVITDRDQSMVAKLTKAQTAVIKLHKDVLSTEDSVRGAPVVPRARAKDRSTQTYVALVSFMGLGPGTSRGGSYRPSAQGNVARNFSGPIVAPISDALRERMLAYLMRAGKGVESVGERFSVVAGGGSGRRQEKDQRQTSLWDAHIRNVRARRAQQLSQRQYSGAGGSGGGGGGGGGAGQMSNAGASGNVAGSTKGRAGGSGAAQPGGEGKGIMQLSSDLSILVKEGAITLQQAQTMMAESAREAASGSSGNPGTERPNAQSSSDTPPGNNVAPAAPQSVSNTFGGFGAPEQLSQTGSSNGVFSNQPIFPTGAAGSTDLNAPPSSSMYGSSTWGSSSGGILSSIFPQDQPAHQGGGAPSFGNMSAINSGSLSSDFNSTEANWNVPGASLHSGPGGGAGNLSPHAFDSDLNAFNVNSNEFVPSGGLEQQQQQSQNGQQQQQQYLGSNGGWWSQQ
eukprot:g5155.t1